MRFMRLLRSLCIAFSMYSAIPTPQFRWEEEEMRYALCFFPMVGAVIGAVTVLWSVFVGAFGASRLCFSLVGAAIPVLLTGGFHVDGFMDTMDAFHSYRPKEKKLEILKDPHIGAFSVIMLAAFGLLYVAAYAELYESERGIEIGLGKMGVVALGFVLSRALSGIAVLTFPPAKASGTLNVFADSADRKLVKIWLTATSIASIAGMLYCSLCAGAAAAVAALGIFGYYRVRCVKEIGGITGDTAGWFVVLCECGVVVAVAVVNLILGAQV